MTTYISCACNQVPHSADWGKNGLICFAACHAVAIYDPYISKIGKVTNTLHRHKDRINTVRWIRRKNLKAERELLSSSVDGTAIIWSKRNELFICSSIIEVGDIITFSNSLYISDHDFINDEILFKLLICTGSIKGDLKIWLRDIDGNIKCLETLTFGRKLPIEACFSFLPNTDLPFLAIATENSTIELYVTNSNVVEKLHFIKVQTLIGHEDWIRCMDFNCNIDNSILLASGSQDAMIRLWKISAYNIEFSNDELHQKQQMFMVNGTKYNITLESVLCGHEGWIYGVHWLQLNNKDRILRLLSCSLDKSMIIWEPDKVTGIWLEKVRVGEVGGNSMGFYGCKFSDNGLNILAHGYQGSFHIWEYSNSIKNWIPKSVPSGHFAEVVDLCWDPNGRFLITASIDQTTRIHAPWKNEIEFWHEVGRPQIHGYNMSCLVMLTPYMFASGAEEKVIRIFTAPATFKNCLIKIANVDDFKDVVPDSASVPALGLTNKAIFNNIKIENIETSDFKDEDYIPPMEEELMQNTLWPELQKLYGHGYEIFSITARHDGSLLATACKSTSPEHSAILLWSTNSWTQVQKLLSHQLTVTQMEFSPNDKYLLSVSRDRRWSLFEYKDNMYILIAISLKKDNLHTRIIWCCSWTYDSSFFATGSRDGKIGIWNPNFTNDKIVPATSLDVKNSVTALAFSLQSISQCSYILAIGFETGYIEIHKLKMLFNNFEWEKYIVYDSSQAHHLTVKRLKFRPHKRYFNNLQLASCGSDHTVKIYNIN
ncbi:PREDICTED: probable elongator complex protein 2, partial [Eufriesea mexicana]|uniref:probable elongator complex protein 2 n=1 Tax=Eufriesea mexicana TaxID=516756 RepID=UPI00083C2A25